MEDEERDLKKKKIGAIVAFQIYKLLGIRKKKGDAIC